MPDNQQEMDYSPHFITMTFDMMDPDGRAAFENARQGVERGLVIWDLLQEIRKCLRYGGNPRPDKAADGMCYSETYDAGAVAATEYWRDLIYELMEAHGTTEVE